MRRARESWADVPSMDSMKVGHRSSPKIHNPSRRRVRDSHITASGDLTNTTMHSFVRRRHGNTRPFFDQETGHKANAPVLEMKMRNRKTGGARWWLKCTFQGAPERRLP